MMHTSCPRCGQARVLIDPCPHCGYVKPRDFLLRRMPRNSICAEIGVWRGAFSAEMLAQTQPQQLYLIDPWRFQPDFADSAFGGTVATCQTDMDALYAQVQQRFASDKRVIVVRRTATAALTCFPDGFFDWVYLDGNHHYKEIKKDLFGYYTKVKPGGWITGDDYGWGQWLQFPVKRAVAELVAAKPASLRCVHKNQYLIQKRPYAVV